MSVRSLHRRGLSVAALAAAGLIALSGCGLPVPGSSDAADPTPAASAAGTPAAGASPTRGTGLPDVCALLTRAEVSELAGGRQVVQVDPDGAAAGSAVRHCQWQMSGARLAVFVSPTTAAEFTQAHQGHRAVAGLGDAAVFFSGHLFVRKGGLLVDVYATSSDDAAGERFAKASAEKILGRL